MLHVITVLIHLANTIMPWIVRAGILAKACQDCMSFLRLILKLFKKRDETNGSVNEQALQSNWRKMKVKKQVSKIKKVQEKEEKRHDRVEEAEEARHEKTHDKEIKNIIKSMSKTKVKRK